MVTKKKQNNSKYVGRPLMVITENGTDVYKIKEWGNGQVSDSEGNIYTRSMVRGALVNNQIVYYVVVEAKAFQTIEQLSWELGNVVLAEVTRVVPDALKLVQWIVMGVMSLMLILTWIQFNKLETVTINAYASTDAKVNQVLNQLDNLKIIYVQTQAEIIEHQGDVPSLIPPQ